MKLAELKPLTLGDLQAFAQTFWEGVTITAMSSGNITSAQAVTMLKDVESLVKPVSDVAEAELSVLALPNQLLHRTIESDHTDSGYVLYWQGAGREMKTQAQWMLLGHLLEADYYNQLRTEQQLGYLVFESYYPILTVPGLIFAVQSPGASAADIHQATLTFIEQSKEKLLVLDEAALNRHVETLVQGLRERSKKLVDESNQYWHSLALGISSLDLNADLANALETLTLEGLASLCDGFCMPIHRPDGIC